MKHRIVVLGAGYAGIVSSLRLSSRLGELARITLVSPTPFFVERIRLHQAAVHGREVRHDLSRLLRGRSVEVVVGTATRIDVEAQRVELEGAEPLAWDSLVMATGSVADVPSFARPEDASIAGLHGADALRARLGELAPGSRVVVAGGGLTGLELASELAEGRPDLRVAIVSPEIGGALSAGGARYLESALGELGVAVVREAIVERTQDGVGLASGGELGADIVAWCTGMRAASLAAEAGLACDELGRVLVDPCFRAEGHPHVRVAGDAAHAFANPVRMACATAIPMGCAAADALAAELRGREPRPFGFAFGGRCVSLGRRRGLVQVARADDSPRDLAFTGWTGARLKEAVCRYAMSAFWMERVLGPSYRWPAMHGSRVAGLKAGEPSPQLTARSTA